LDAKDFLNAVYKIRLALVDFQILFKTASTHTNYLFPHTVTTGTVLWEHRVIQIKEETSETVLFKRVLWILTSTTLRCNPERYVTPLHH
jgi:hypothetical protein